VFDVNETLIDIVALEPYFERVFGDRDVLREWFGQLVMYSMAVTLSSNYVDFFSLGQAVLRMTADVHRVRISDDDVSAFGAGMATMPAHPDVADGLWALSNGSRVGGGAVGVHDGRRPRVGSDRRAGRRVQRRPHHAPRQRATARTRAAATYGGRR
jgi:hypothetical protein